VEARQRRAEEAAELRGLAAYDQARHAKTSAWTDEERAEMAAQRARDNAPGIESRFVVRESWGNPSGAPNSSLSAAQAGWEVAVERILAAMPTLSDAELDAMLDREDRAAEAGVRALAMREARRRCGAGCP
jgi:hypothetical protein